MLLMRAPEPRNQAMAAPNITQQNTKMGGGEGIVPRILLKQGLQRSRRELTGRMPSGTERCPIWRIHRSPIALVEAPLYWIARPDYQ